MQGPGLTRQSSLRIYFSPNTWVIRKQKKKNEQSRGFDHSPSSSFFPSLLFRLSGVLIGDDVTPRPCHVAQNGRRHHPLYSSLMVHVCSFPTPDYFSFPSTAASLCQQEQENIAGQEGKGEERKEKTMGEKHHLCWEIRNNWALNNYQKG